MFDSIRLNDVSGNSSESRYREKATEGEKIVGIHFHSSGKVGQNVTMYGCSDHGR
jgi:hypothetical protein